MVRADPQVSLFLPEPGHSASHGFLDVARAARQTRRRRDQSRPRFAVHDEEDHGEVCGAISSGGFDRLRLRHPSRHRPPSRSRCTLPAHRARRVCGMQHVPHESLGKQEPDGLSPLVLRAGEQTLGTDARSASKVGESPFKAARRGQDDLLAASESFPDGRTAQCANRGGDPPATIPSIHPQS